MTLSMTRNVDLRMVSRIQTPIDYALDLQGFKEWLKWDASDQSENNTMSTNLFAAAKQCEAFTRRKLMRATFRTFIEYFPCSLRLDVHPIDLSTVVVKYYDTDNVLQTLDASEYFKRDNGPDAYAEILFEGTMPNVYDRREPIYIEYNAGYAPGELPEPLLSGILKRGTDLTENRSNEHQGSISQTQYSSEHLWFPYKMMR